MIKLIYEDEYGQIVYSCTSDIVPSQGDLIQLNDELWYVKSRTIFPQTGQVLVELAESLPNKSTVSITEDSGRLHDLQNTIISVTKRQDVLEKKTRALTDQLSNIKRQRNERKDNDTR